LVVFGQLALGGGPEQFDVMLRLRNDASTDKISFLAMPDHLRAADAAERPQRCQQVNRFENVSFALGVVAEEQVEPRRKIRIHPRVIAEVAKPEMSQMHAEG
jgi:hypothetical protein